MRLFDVGSDDPAEDGRAHDVPRASDGFLRSRSPPGDWTSCGRGEDGELSRRGSDQYVQWDLTPSSRRSGIGMSKRRVRGGGECARTEGRRDLGSRPPSLRDTGVLRCALTRIRRGSGRCATGRRPGRCATGRRTRTALVRPGDSPSFEGSRVRRACWEGGGTKFPARNASRPPASAAPLPDVPRRAGD